MYKTEPMIDKNRTEYIKLIADIYNVIAQISAAETDTARSLASRTMDGQQKTEHKFQI